MENQPLYSLSILIVAAKKSFVSILWVAALIGLLPTLFDTRLSGPDKVIAFVTVLVVIWLVWFIARLAMHRKSLKSKDRMDTYLAKNDTEKGKELSSFMEVF